MPQLHIRLISLKQLKLELPKEMRKSNNHFHHCKSILTSASPPKKKTLLDEEGE